MDGVINFFKPKGMTSHDAVSFLRRTLKTKRIGHTGTLDPEVSGVLPLCVEKGTRIAEYLLDIDKEYIAEATLGIKTDTQDLEGKVIGVSEKIVTENDIITTMSNYIGNIDQIPPMYSALKHQGKKLYELAREGIVVERKPRNITIYNQEILNIEDNKKILFYTKCSKGTYIRTLCEDIGEDLGTYAYMSYLIRVGVGNFKIENAYSMDYISSLKPEEISKIITPMDEALNHFDKLILPDELFSKIINGVMVTIDFDEIYELERLYKIYCDNKFIGIGRIILKDSIKYLKMNKVLLI